MSDDSKLEQLKARLVSGDLSPEDERELLAHLRNHEEEFRELAGHLAIDRLLCLALEPSEEEGAFSLEVAQRLKSERNADSFSRKVEERLSPKPILWRRLALPLAATLTFLGVLGWFVSLDRSFARVRATADLVLPADSRDLALGAKINRGETVEVREGFLELRFPRRGHVVLEGPATFTVQGREEFTLESGRAVFLVTRRGRGLTVHTPQGSVIDLGTSFALEVSPDSSELHVLQGAVRFDSPAHGSWSLQAGESLRSTPAEALNIPPDPDHFVRKLPSAGPSRDPYLYWSFDEGGGSTAEAIGSDPDFRLSLSSTPGDSPPDWTPGRSGTGLSLNGAGAFTQCAFPGIEGSTHRTVALWVKVPRDWTPEDGGALVSWGRTGWRAPGALFELTLNREPELGPLGAPQLDTYGSRVTIAQDLLDGQWHHLAVSTFQDNKKSSRTNVLFYLDGKLVSSQPQSIPRLDTVAGGTRHSVLLGRTAQSLNSVEPPREAFFRGSLDEVMISPRALSSRELKDLMTGQLPPRQ